MAEVFDAAAEPMRAIRDLIVACEVVFGADNGEEQILERARLGFDTLRRLFGDHVAAEDCAHGPMVEPTFTREIAT